MGIDHEVEALYAAAKDLMDRAYEIEMQEKQLKRLSDTVSRLLNTGTGGSGKQPGKRSGNLRNCRIIRFSKRRK